MGLFDFVSSAGSKLGGKIYDVVNDEADPTAPSEVSQERINALRAESISKNIAESGVVVSDLGVQVDGGLATLTGKVATQADFEKLALIAGNQFGISQVDCQLEVEKAAVAAQMYTVKSGDTLGKIAREFYGDAAKYPQIFEANQPMLTDPNKIYVGQVLRIPNPA